MASEIPGHYPQLATATTGGLTTGLINDDANFVIVTSAAAGNFVTLPLAVGYIGEVIRGSIGANGFKLTTPLGSATTINTVAVAGAIAGAAIPANSEWTAIRWSATNWIVSSRTSAGAAGATITPA